MVERLETALETQAELTRNAKFGVDDERQQRAFVQQSLEEARDELVEK